MENNRERFCSKKLHNFDLQGLQWRTPVRPRAFSLSNDSSSEALMNRRNGSPAKSEASFADASRFVFKAGMKDVEKVNEMVSNPSKLAENLKNLTIPGANDDVFGSSQAEERLKRLGRIGKQVKDGPPCPEDDAVKGIQFLTKRREMKKSVSLKGSADKKTSKESVKGAKTGGLADNEGSKRWNLRDRKSIRLSRAASSNPFASSPIRGLDKGKEKQVDPTSQNNNDKGKLEMPKLPSFSLTLTPEEIMEDLTKLLGKPPPKKVKKRARNVQKQVDLVFPGGNLENITMDRYKVPENSTTRKGK